MFSLFRKKNNKNNPPNGKSNMNKTERELLNEKCSTNIGGYVLYISNTNTNFVIIEQCSSGNGLKEYIQINADGNGELTPKCDEIKKILQKYKLELPTLGNNYIPLTSEQSVPIIKIVTKNGWFIEKSGGQGHGGFRDIYYELKEYKNGILEQNIRIPISKEQFESIKKDNYSKITDEEADYLINQNKSQLPIISGGKVLKTKHKKNTKTQKKKYKTKRNMTAKRITTKLSK